MNKTDIKALTFDVFGTVVDWRSSIIAEGRTLADHHGINIDWAAFADAWRGGYEPSMDRVRQGELPWMNIDALHRLILDGLLNDFGIEQLSEDEISNLNEVWHRLEPWPDVRANLERLRKNFSVATLSNGNVALLTNMSKRANLRWDCILSSELAGHYKPDAEVYTKAAMLLGLQPSQVMMVAAHNSDLQAAKRVGFRPAFVHRKTEYGPDQKTDLSPDEDYDIVAEDFGDLADQLV